MSPDSKALNDAVAERRRRDEQTNPPVGPDGTQPGEATELPDFTDDELQRAAVDLQRHLANQRDDAATSARRQRYGQPSSRGPGYYAAKLALLEQLLAGYDPQRACLDVP